MIQWIASYILIGLIFMLLVEFMHTVAVSFNVTEDDMENSDRWIISLLWPIGVVVMIKSLIEYFVNRE
tara:strand:+ start:620 stop:823 length:204 start_codon:yes stop_codon:yes gene_type:complete